MLLSRLKVEAFPACMITVSTVLHQKNENIILCLNVIHDLKEIALNSVSIAMKT